MDSAKKPLQIFASGRHTATSGAVLEFSDDDLAACAAAYNPAIHEAPLVVGHPRADLPAYGWVKSLSVGAGLEAESCQVDPAFAEMVNTGRFKKISASFYAPDAPQNPVPGVYYLRHVGFLGAQPPAVKGLRSPEFAQAEEGIVEFSEWSERTTANLFRRLRDWLIGEKGLETADRIIPDYAVATLEDEVRQEPPAVQPTFTETPQQETTVTEEQRIALEAENAQLKATLAANVARDKVTAATGRHTANVQFAEGLAAAGRLLPAQTAVAVAALDNLAGQETPVEFGEGDTKKPLFDAVKDLLAALPVQVEFGEHATQDKAGAAKVDVTNAQSIADRALEFQEAEAKAGREISITTAVQHVTAAAK